MKDLFGFDTDVTNQFGPPLNIPADQGSGLIGVEAQWLATRFAESFL
jgi:hypothetical protein